MRCYRKIHLTSAVSWLQSRFAAINCSVEAAVIHILSLFPYKCKGLLQIQIINKHSSDNKNTNTTWE